MKGFFGQKGLRGFGNASASFSPLSLFASSEPGFLYDPSDISTLFQDSAGTTPVTAAGQSVGLMLDKSGRGNHATQSTSLSRPTLGRNPVGGTRNLLTYTEQFDNAAWSKTSATVTANSLAAPDGLMTADTITAAAGSGIAPLMIQTGTTVASTIYTASIFVRPGTHTFVQMYIGSQNADWCNFTLTGSGSVKNNGAAVGAISFDSATGYYRISMTYTAGGTDRRPGITLVPSGTATRVPNGTYAGTETIHIWGAQFETGSTATAYQKVVSAFDVTEAGKADCWYLSFDGSDDFLVTPTITPGTDKVQVFAGVRKLSGAATGTIIDLNGVAGTGAIMLRAPSGVSENYAWYSGGSLAFAGAVSAGSFVAPITNVITGIGDISADTQILRVNGAQVAASSADQGTGNYLSQPLYIGRRGGTGVPFNGRIYSLICRFGPNLSAGQIAQVENWVNGKTGAY